MLRVGLVSPAIVCLPLWVAQDQGLLDAAGLDVAVAVLGTTDATADALAGGEVDAAFGTPDRALAAPEHLRVLAALANKPPLSLVAQPQIRSCSDLRGLEIGTSSLREGTVHLVQAMLAAHGLHYPRDYGFALAGAHPQRWKALQDGSLAAALQLVPLDYVAEDAGFSILGRAEDYVPWFAFSAVCVRSGWAAENPRVAEAFHGALLEAVGRVYRNRDEAARIAAGRTGTSFEHARRGVIRITENEALPPDLRLHPEAARRTLEAMASSPAGAD